MTDKTSQSSKNFVEWQLAATLRRLRVSEAV
jgi:hypothetical protein